MSGAEGRGADRPRTLPFIAIAVAFALILAAQVGGAYLLADRLSWTRDTRVGVVVGGFVSIAGCSIALIAIRPWTPRPVSEWTVLWIAATAIRFLFTPIALFSVYSATLLPGPAVFLGGAAAYVVALAAESVVIARARLATEAISAAGSASRGDV